MNDLLTPTFGETFKVTLNYPLWITSDPYKLKEEIKRGLLEMVDTYDKLSLAYSGGSDSGFVLCCIHDLIEEGKLKKDTIEIFIGIFVADGRPQADANRAIRFANSLGFDPKKVVLNLDNTPDIHDAIVDQTFKNIEKFGGLLEEIDFLYPSSLQDYACSLQDSTVIRAHTLGSPLINASLYESVDWGLVATRLKHYDSDINEVEMFLWDNKIASSFISPYKLKKSPIDTEPILKLFNISKIPAGPIGPATLDAKLDRWMIYLQCYPKMTTILYKFRTLPYNISNSFAGYKMMEFKEKIKSYETKIAELQLPSGEYFTRKHLTNYKDYFET